MFHKRIRKITCKPYALRSLVPFIALLMATIALAALAQTLGASQASGRGSAAPVQANAGAPFFLAPVIYNPNGFGFDRVSVAVADLNGDGKPDLLVANRFACEGCAGSLAVLLGNGDGTFQSAVTYDSGGAETESVAVADVNADGKPDVIVGNQGSPGGVGVLLGNGDGTLQPVVTYSLPFGGADDIAVRDVNGDGKVDVLALRFCFGPHCTDFASDGAVTVLLGRGDGTFQGLIPIYDSGGRNAMSIAVADVNGDGKPDLVVANQCTNRGCTTDFHGVLGVMLGNGDGTFQPVENYAGGNHTSDAAIADVNGDGKPDLLEVDIGSGAGVLLGNGDGTFQQRVGYSTGGYTSIAMVAADVNNDGKLDLVVENNAGFDNPPTIGVLLGNGDGTFQPAVTQAEGDPRGLAVADLNGDGRLDLVVGTTDGNLTPLVGVMLHVGAIPTTTTLLSLNPSVFGQLVTFTAKVTSPSGTPTGAVSFFDGPSLLGSATLVARKASLPVSALAVGSHAITAVYQGSAMFNSGTSTSRNQVVNTATTTTSLVSSLNPALINESVTYTATVTSQNSGAVTGTVTFEDGATTLASAVLVGNQAAVSTRYAAQGTHTITATYSGDLNNTGSMSSALTEQINKGLPSKTVLITSGSPSLVGQPVTFTATVTSTSGMIPDGELVTFYDGTMPLASVALSGQVAAFTTSALSGTTHPIKATYVGDSQFRSSTGSIMQVVEKYPTTTTLSSSLNPSTLGQAVTFTATVTASGPFALTAKVKFLDGTALLGSAALSNGLAKLTKSTLSVGTHPITAEYLGDTGNAKSTSAVVNQTVQ